MTDTRLEEILNGDVPTIEEFDELMKIWLENYEEQKELNNA